MPHRLDGRSVRIGQGSRQGVYVLIGKRPGYSAAVSELAGILVPGFLRHYRLKAKMRLTTSGPYAYVRNPIYIGNTLILIGCAVLSELLWFVPVMLAWCALVYGGVMRVEEKRLV